jgi:hypothetical protein
MREPLVAVFDSPDAASQALRALQQAQVVGARVASPAPFPAVHLTGLPGPWRVLGKVALFGGLTGLACAAALQAITSESLGLVVGGKPILAWPAFGVIMFELTMLFAGAANFLALVILGAMARRQLPRAARDLVDSEHVVVVVPGDQLDGARGVAVRQALAGAVHGARP